MATEYPILTNGAGEGCKDFSEIIKILTNNPCNAAVAGSITIEERKGSREPNFYYSEKTGESINHIGLKNPGLNYYIERLPMINAYTKSFDKLKNSVLIMSVAYAHVDNSYGEISAEELNKHPATQFEILNEKLVKSNPGMKMFVENDVSCPNESEDGSLLYEDLKLISQILENIEKASGKKRYTIKFGYMLPGHLNKMAEVVSSYDPFGIVATNTLPGLMLDEKGRSRIYERTRGKGGYGGVGGRGIAPLSLGIVSRLRQKFDKLGRNDINVIGSGGASTPDRGMHLMLRGARYLQVGTEYMVHGENDPSLFSKYLSQLIGLNEELGSPIKFDI